MEDKTMLKGTWAAGFTVASIWFATHVGGGFATGNQIIQYFVTYGWTAVLFSATAMALLAYTIYVIMKFCRMRDITNYKDAYRELWAPYSWMEYTFEVFYFIIILAAVASAIAGAATLLNVNLGLNYVLSCVIVSLILIVLSIFGVKLIITASTVLSILILITTAIIIVAGLAMNPGGFDPAVMKPNNTGMAIWRGIIIYAGFQCVSIPGMIAGGTTLTGKGVKKASILGGIMNGGALALSALMLLGWYPQILDAKMAHLPNQFVVNNLGIKILAISYSVLLFCAFVSTCVTLIYTLVNRFDDKFFPNTIKEVKVRRTIIAVIIISVCMSLSFVGLSNIIKYGYGYDGYIAVFFIMIPTIIIGNIKNKKYGKEHPESLLK
ncbi:MAG: hypothetical protein GX684_07570 [Ruminococcaceae bacterium]|nr:hypothetical protein [Oscillospiraceae bacterium]